MRIKTLERHVLVWQPLAWDWRRNLTLSPRPVVPSGFTQAPHTGTAQHPLFGGSESEFM